jgi:hypothetical protein
LGTKNNDAAKSALTLEIKVTCPSKNVQFVGTYDNHSLSSEAKHIFYDVENLFDYIKEHHLCKARIYFDV